MSTDAGQFLDYKALFYKTRDMVESARKEVDKKDEKIRNLEADLRRYKARLLRAHDSGFCAQTGSYCDYCEPKEA